MTITTEANANNNMVPAPVEMWPAHRGIGGASRRQRQQNPSTRSPQRSQTQSPFRTFDSSMSPLYQRQNRKQ